MYQPLALAAFTAVLLFTGIAQAQAEHAPINCAKVDTVGGSQWEMSVCEGRNFAAADAELNKVYGQLRQHFQKNHDIEAEMLMVKAQRAWVTWRDAEGELCAQSRGFGRGGSAYDTVAQSCETYLTKERVKQLREHLQDAERL